MIKSIVYSWLRFRKAGRAHKGNHHFFCKKHRKVLNGSHCYMCFTLKLKSTKATTRPLCKQKNGIVPPTDHVRRVRMKKKAFWKLLKRYRINNKKYQKKIRNLLRSNKG